MGGRSQLTGVVYGMCRLYSTGKVQEECNVLTLVYLLVQLSRWYQNLRSNTFFFMDLGTLDYDTSSLLSRKIFSTQSLETKLSFMFPFGTVTVS